MPASVDPRVTLVMPNRDNAPVLDLVLGRLAEHTNYPNFELIVIDDGSSDRSLEILRRWRDSGRFEDFRLIEHEHAGVVAALNAGLEAASGELVVQLDADASVETPGWLERMVAFFSLDQKVGVVTGKVVFDWGQIHACGIAVLPEGLHDGGTELTEAVGRRTYHQRVLRRREGECEACERPAEVDGGIGCCMMYRRADALAVGGYDLGYAPVWFDDLDLTFSLRRHGLKVFFLPDVRVVHHLSKRTEKPTLKHRLSGLIQYLAYKLLPLRASVRLIRALELDRMPKKSVDRLTHHYAYWAEKWGFDILNPDMDAVRERWGDTEICWSTNPEMRAAGERIVAAYEAAGEGSRRRAA